MSGFIIKLDREFYLRPTLNVARDLIGKFLVYEKGRERLAIRLVEVEAYIGEEDPACHASVGRTKRNEVMYGPGGFSYIYFIYGMHYCLNVVTEKEGFPAAVLIRAGEPIEGTEIMRKHYSNHDSNRLTDGPGKICKALGLTREHNGLDLVESNLYLEDRGHIFTEIAAAKRIGIRNGTDKLWRFAEKGSPWLSAGIK